MARTYTCQLDGLNSGRVMVEAEILKGFSAFYIVGLAGTSIQESKERVRSALAATGLKMPLGRIVINLFPGDIHKGGTQWDLPIALSLLACMGLISPQEIQDKAFIGELALDGSIRPLPAAYAMALCLKKAGSQQIFIPQENLADCRRIEGVDFYPCRHLSDLLSHFRKERPIPAVEGGGDPPSLRGEGSFDYANLLGQPVLKRILMAAAIGGHSLLLIGPPGVGKTLAISHFHYLLPPLEKEEREEVNLLYSLAGQERDLSSSLPPCRAPHYTTSRAGLIGGGNPPAAGEVSLAHHGVLFLDELAEFSREKLNTLRTPLEEGVVRLVRGNRHYIYPARFQLLAAMNPCPCGYYGDPYHSCRCLPYQVSRYLNKIPGPLIDRFDLVYELPVVRFGEGGGKKDPWDSQRMRGMIREGRGRRQKMRASTEETEGRADQLADHFRLSARRRESLLQLGASLAALDGKGEAEPDYLYEAYQYIQAAEKFWPH